MIRYQGRLSALVKDEIIHRIREKRMQPGEQLPSEEQLAAELQVSRPTIRDALNLLEVMGYINRQHGRGTFITGFSVLESGLESWKSLSELIKESGKKPSARIQELKEGFFGHDVHNQLNLSSKEACVRLTRIRLADDEPVSFILNHFPRKVFGQTVLTEDMFQESLVVLMEEQFNVRFLYAMSSFTPEVLTAEMAEHLNFPAGTPTLRMDFVHYNDRDEPILLGQEWYPKDTVKFHIKRFRQR